MIARRWRPYPAIHYQKQTKRQSLQSSNHNLNVCASSSNGSSPATTTGISTRPTLTGIRSGQRVFGKGACKCLLASNFLATHKALYRDSDGTVNVGRRDIVTQAHAAESLADTDDGLQVTDLKDNILARST